MQLLHNAEKSSRVIPGQLDLLHVLANGSCLGWLGFGLASCLHARGDGCCSVSDVLADCGGPCNLHIRVSTPSPSFSRSFTADSLGIASNGNDVSQPAAAVKDEVASPAPSRVSSRSTSSMDAVAQRAKALFARPDQAQAKAQAAPLPKPPSPCPSLAPPPQRTKCEPAPSQTSMALAVAAPPAKQTSSLAAPAPPTSAAAAVKTPTKPSPPILRQPPASSNSQEAPSAAKTGGVNPGPNKKAKFASPVAAPAIENQQLLNTIHAIEVHDTEVHV